MQLSTMTNVPIGHYRESGLVNLSLHRWAVDGSLVLSWHDPESGWDISAKAGYTTNGDNRDSGYDSGDEIHIEGAIEKALPLKFSLGVQGYYQKQVGDDRGMLGPFREDVRRKVTARGNSDMKRAIAVASGALLMLAPPLAHAQDDEAVSVASDAPAEQSLSAGFAEQLANPVAKLISVPIQFHYDCCYGPADGGRLTVNAQPVIPFSVGEDWNLITRTIVPIITQGETIRGAGGTSGLGDVVQSFFFSPKEPKNGLVWDVGPAIL
ncbi:transporter [Novosphingobium sp. BW1]|uniref:transporter n=1 Tax=Novosphingobium sp. BW1 TaxID=2592621 RepID=UPI0021109DB9|nr:transporter [Novosphingobium sp. BW1]